MLIHEQDADSLRRFLGVEQIPEKYEREYHLRLRMFHADGHSGPLGTIALIDLLRFCGFTPEFAQPKAEAIDWDKVLRGTRVEASFGGAWQEGEFVGFGENRVLVVRLDNDDFLRECRKDYVRLAAACEPVQTPITADAVTEYGEAGWATEEIDWAKAESGVDVWAEVNGEPCDGKFVELATEGSVTIEVNGEMHVVPTSQVTLASVASV